MKFYNTKKGRVVYFQKMILSQIEDSFDVRIMAPNHYRIESRTTDRRVDYFPKSEKCFLLNEQKWGSILLLELEEKLKKYLK